MQPEPRWKIREILPIFRGFASLRLRRVKGIRSS
jgi:hypothetical protein